MNKGKQIISVQAVELATYSVNLQMYTDDSSTQSNIRFLDEKTLKFALLKL